MALLSITDLFTPRTKDEILQTFLDGLATLGFDTTAWQSGGVVRTILSVVADTCATFSTTISEMSKGGFLDYAGDGWIDILALSVYGVTRQAAVFARGQVRLTNASATPYTVATGDLHLAHATTGKTYKNSDPFTLNASSSLDVFVAADEVGSASNAGVGTITVMVTSLVGVTVTNTASVLGSDKESLSALALRCREKLGALSPNGPKEIYNYIAKTTGTFTGAAITRAKTVLTPSTGYVTVYIANVNGAVPGADVTQVDTAIQSQAVPFGITATTLSATAKTINVTCTVWVQGSALTTAEIQAEVSAQLSVYFATLPIGGLALTTGGTAYVYNDALIDQIYQADSKILHVVIVAPAADTSIAVNEVPVVGTITVSVITL